MDDRQEIIHSVEHIEHYMEHVLHIPVDGKGVANNGQNRINKMAKCIAELSTTDSHAASRMLESSREILMLNFGQADNAALAKFIKESVMPIQGKSAHIPYLQALYKYFLALENVDSAIAQRFTLMLTNLSFRPEQIDKLVKILANSHSIIQKATIQLDNLKELSDGLPELLAQFIANALHGRVLEDRVALFLKFKMPSSAPFTMLADDNREKRINEFCRLYLRENDIPETTANFDEVAFLLSAMSEIVPHDDTIDSSRYVLLADYLLHIRDVLVSSKNRKGEIGGMIALYDRVIFADLIENHVLHGKPIPKHFSKTCLGIDVGALHLTHRDSNDFASELYKAFLKRYLGTQQHAGLERLAELLAHLSTQNGENARDLVHFIVESLLNSSKILAEHGQQRLKHIQPKRINEIDFDTVRAIFFANAIEPSDRNRRIAGLILFTGPWTMVRTHGGIPLQILTAEKKLDRYKAFCKFYFKILPSKGDDEKKTERLLKAVKAHGKKTMHQDTTTLDYSRILSDLN